MHRPPLQNNLPQTSQQNRGFSQSWSRGSSGSVASRNECIQGQVRHINRTIPEHFFSKSVASYDHHPTLTQDQNLDKNFKFLPKHPLPHNNSSKVSSGVKSYPNSGIMLTQPMHMQTMWTSNPTYPCTQPFQQNYSNCGASGAMSFTNSEMHPGMMTHQPTNIFEPNVPGMPVYWSSGVPRMPLQEYMGSKAAQHNCQNAAAEVKGHSKKSFQNKQPKENKLIKVSKNFSSEKTVPKEPVKIGTTKPPSPKQKPETLFVATTANGLRSWRDLKENVICEVIGTLNSQISSQGRHEKSFLLQDSQGGQIRCNFFETDRDIPKMWRGRRYRCVGKYKLRQDLFHALSVREATEKDVRAHRKLVAIGNMRLRSEEKI